MSLTGCFLVTLYLETIFKSSYLIASVTKVLYTNKEKMVKTLSEAFVRSDTRHQFKRNFLEENKQKSLESTKEDGKDRPL